MSAPTQAVPGTEPPVPPAAVPQAIPDTPRPRSTALRVGRNASFLLAAQIAYSLINVAAVVLLGNGLAARGYGEYAFYYALIPLVAAVSDGGIGIILTRSIARDHAGGPRLLGDALLIKGAISGTVLLVALAVAWTTLDPAHALVVSMVAAAAILLHNQDPAIWVLRARERLEIESLLLLLSQVVWFVLLAVGVMRRAGLAWLLGAAAAAYLVRFLTGMFIVLWPSHRPVFEPDRGRLGRMLGEGLPLGAAALGSAFYMQIGVILVRALATPVDVARFNVSFMFSQPLSFIANVLGIALFPLIARDVKGDPRALRRDLASNVKWQVLFAAPLAAILFLLAGPIVRLMFHKPGFGPAVTGIRLLSLGLPVFFLNVSLRYVLAALDRQREYFRAVLAGLAANAGLGALLIPRLGFLGACGAFLGAELVILTTCEVAVARQVGWRDQILPILKPILAALLAGVPVYALHGANLFVRLGAAFVSYPVLLLLVRALTPGELRTIRRLVSSFLVRAPRSRDAVPSAVNPGANNTGEA